MFDEPGFPLLPDAEDYEAILQHFVYCSRAAEGIDAGEVDRLVAFSQQRNVARGITGVLVFSSGVFFQWIEGSPAEVQKLVESLHGDTRHTDVVSLDTGTERRERLYPDWDMELVEADDIRAVLHDALESTEDENNAAALRRILQHLNTAPLTALGQE